jgi:hypothetical protein
VRMAVLERVMAGGMAGGMEKKKTDGATAH